MNVWEQLAITPEATRNEVLRAYERKANDYLLTRNMEALERLKAARDSCLQRIEDNFDRLMATAATGQEDRDEEDVLLRALHLGRVNDFLDTTTWDKSPEFNSLHWLISVAERPIETLSTPSAPESVPMDLVYKLMLLHHRSLNEIDWTDHLNQGRIRLDQMPAVLLASLDRDWLCGLFDDWGAEHPFIPGPAGHLLALRRLRLRPEAAWIHHLNTTWEDSALDDGDVLLFDLLQSLMPGRRPVADTVLSWLESLVLTSETGDLSNLSSGPDIELGNSTLAEYARWWMRRICNVDEPAESLPPGLIPPLPVLDDRLIRDTDLPHDAWRPLKQPQFLLWAILGFGLAGLDDQLGTDPLSGPLTSTAIAFFLVLTFLMVRSRFGVIDTRPPVLWSTRQGTRLSRQMATSPPIVLEVLQIRSANNGLEKMSRLRASIALQILERPPVLCLWIKNWLESAPLVDGPLRRALDETSRHLGDTLN